MIGPNVRSNFHLSDRDALIKRFEDAGFINAVAWYELMPFNYKNKEDFEELLTAPNTVKQFAAMDKDLAE